MKASTSERLKKVMDERGLRQVDVLNLVQPFCEKHDITLSKSQLSEYISGRCEPKQKKLKVLADALSVSPAWLMGLEVPMLPMQQVEVTDEEKALLDMLRAASPEAIELIKKMLK